jgi:hypothetical protein
MELLASMHRAERHLNRHRFFSTKHRSVMEWNLGARPHILSSLITQLAPDRTSEFLLLLTFVFFLRHLWMTFIPKVLLPDKIGIFSIV